MILDGLLFKILDTDTGAGDTHTVLCIPTSKVHVLMDYYHSSVMGGHFGITKCFQTISKRFYCPNLAEQLRAYITGCHICQLFKKGRHFDRPFHKRININVPAMTKISMDLKQIPPAMVTLISWLFCVKFQTSWLHYHYNLPEYRPSWMLSRRDI